MSDPTPESIIGTVVGEMLALRKGPNHHTGEVADAVVAQIEILRSAFDSLREENARLLSEVERLTRERDFYSDTLGKKQLDIYELQVKLDGADKEARKHSRNHNPEVCVDVQEYAEKLKNERDRLRAESKRWRGNMHRKLGNLIGPEIFPHRELLCSSCSGKGTGLTCSSCDTFDNEEMGRLVEERSDLRTALATARREERERCAGLDPHKVACPVCSAGPEHGCHGTCPRWPRYAAAIRALGEE